MAEEIKTILTIDQVIEYAKKYGYTSLSCEVPKTTEIVLIKEWLRTKYKIHVTNEQSERGSMNYKTEEYFACDISQRQPHPSKPRRRWIARSSFQTFDNYVDAAIFGIIWAINHYVDKDALNKFLDELRERKNAIPVAIKISKITDNNGNEHEVYANIPLDTELIAKRKIIAKDDLGASGLTFDYDAFIPGKTYKVVKTYRWWFTDIGYVADEAGTLHWATPDVFELKINNKE